MRKIPFVSLDKAREIAEVIPTPFHIYDEAGIRQRARDLKAAFAWNPGFKEYFAVKATPNPYILKLLHEEGCLTIHNIFADSSVTIDDVAAAFGAEVREIALGFAPACAEGWEISELREEDCNFFVRGGVFEVFEERKLRIPSLSHA